MTIYDYCNMPTDIDIDEDNIVAIFVVVINGDEVVTVMFKDNSLATYDAAPDERWGADYDGSYVIAGKDRIRQWLDFTPCAGPPWYHTASYERLDQFKKHS